MSERRLSRQHLVENDSCAPNVDLVVVRSLREDLGRIVRRSSSLGHHLLGTWIPLPRHIEVNHIDCVVFSHDEVIWLDVSVNNVLGVEIDNCIQNLPY